MDQNLSTCFLLADENPDAIKTYIEKHEGKKEEQPFHSDFQCYG